MRKNRKKLLFYSFFLAFSCRSCQFLKKKRQTHYFCNHIMHDVVCYFHSLWFTAGVLKFCFKKSKIMDYYRLWAIIKDKKLIIIDKKNYRFFRPLIKREWFAAVSLLKQNLHTLFNSLSNNRFQVFYQWKKCYTKFIKLWGAYRRCHEKTSYVLNYAFFTLMHKWVDRGQIHHFEKLQNYTSSDKIGITHRGICPLSTHSCNKMIT